MTGWLPDFSGRSRGCQSVENPNIQKFNEQARGKWNKLPY
jgi:hypothetical protein